MSPHSVLITGGAGFIGANAAARMLQEGRRVIVVDNLSRKGAQENLRWLQNIKGDLAFERSDIRNSEQMARVIAEHSPATVFHLAAQVAVTTSVEAPREDFEINALGTFNVLEAVRKEAPEAIVLYASTNKVYGHLDHLPLEEGPTSFRLSKGEAVRETTPLDFFSPYGCSKGAADQYVLDYSRIYGLRAASFRQSCIYGYRQFGIEDQGWVAWFTIAHVIGREITIYGTGKQVRDILFIDDLIDLFQLAEARVDDVNGRAFNIGGGPANAISLLDFLDVLGEISGRPVEFSFGDSRPGDQPFYVSDISLARQALGWIPTTDKVEGIEKLYKWVYDNKTLF